MEIAAAVLDRSGDNPRPYADNRRQRRDRRIRKYYLVGNPCCCDLTET